MDADGSLDAEKEFGGGGAIGSKPGVGAWRLLSGEVGTEFMYGAIALIPD